MIRFNVRKIEDLSVAAAFALLCFTFFTSWGGFVGGLVDRGVYLEQFSTGNVSSNYLEFDTVVAYVTNEWLWNAGVYALVRVVGSADYVLHGLSLLSIFVFGAFVVRNGGVFYLVFLLSPLFFDLVFSQIRIAVAFSLLLIAYEVRGVKFATVLFCFCAVLIHTASVLFGGIYLLLKFVPLGRRYLFVVLLALLVSVFLGPLREFVLGYFGDRRALYGDMSSSVLYMSYWWVLLILFVLSGFGPVNNKISEMALVILGVACFNQIFGFYSTRFLAVGLPLIACGISSMRSNICYYLAIFGFVLNTIVQWIYWFMYSYQ